MMSNMTSRRWVLAGTIVGSLSGDLACQRWSGSYETEKSTSPAIGSPLRTLGDWVNADETVRTTFVAAFARGYLRHANPVKEKELRGAIDGDLLILSTPADQSDPLQQPLDSIAGRAASRLGWPTPEGKIETH